MPSSTFRRYRVGISGWQTRETRLVCNHSQVITPYGIPPGGVNHQKPQTTTHFITGGTVYTTPPQRPRSRFVFWLNVAKLCSLYRHSGGTSPGDTVLTVVTGLARNSTLDGLCQTFLSVDEDCGRRATLIFSAAHRPLALVALGFARTLIRRKRLAWRRVEKQISYRPLNILKHLKHKRKILPSKAGSTWRKAAVQRTPLPRPSSIGAVYYFVVRVLTTR